MALTTVAAIRATAGIDADFDFNLFRLPDEAALDGIVQTALTQASAWIRLRASSTYYTGSATTNADADDTFRLAEELMAAHFLFLRLKARRVFGTHFPYLQEGSERFAELIDEEIPKQVETLIGQYVTVETDQTAYALASMIVTTPTDPSQVQSVDEVLEDLRRESLGLLPLVPGVTPV
ncbi:MAG TPA: hypothetical protein VIM84_07830 [Gemmatimonadales bacterium]